MSSLQLSPTTNRGILCGTGSKEIGAPGDNMLSRYQQDVMEQIRKKLEEVGTPAKVTVTIEVEEV